MGVDGTPGSSRALRLDPYTLPARYAARDGGADGQIRDIELDRDRVVLRREVRGIRMKVGVPVNEFRGVTMRMLPPDGAEPAAVAIMLEHRDNALTVPLFVATDSNDALAQWKSWARVLGVPLLVADDDGALREPFRRIGPLDVNTPTPRRRRRTAIKRRRPSIPLRRKPGRPSATPNIHRDEYEIFAGPGPRDGQVTALAQELPISENVLRSLRDDASNVPDRKRDDAGSNVAFRRGNIVNFPRRQFLHLAAGAAALPAMSRMAQGQTYPSRPITMIVPYPAGGPTDTIARLLGERMRATLGQPVIVENIAGAGGTIGVGRVARAAGDGYTIGIGHWGSHVVNGAIYALPFDLLTDLEPVALISDGPQLVVASKSVPAKNLQELIAWLKASPGQAMVGTTGVGGAAHLASIIFQNTTGTNFQIVPYRGAAPRMQDMLSGQIHLAFDQAASSLPQVRGGNLRAFAVTSKTRLTVAPDIPTVDQAGLPGFYTSVWHGLWSSKNTPKDIVQRLNAAVVEALADSTVRQRLMDLGQELPTREQQTPEALGAYQKSEIDKWWPIIKAAGIKVE
jgi:tripartite-type tricarboxylate transporter receptor subunit TctC